MAWYITSRYFLCVKKNLEILRGVVWHNYNNYNGLAKFDFIFRCGSFLYDKNEYESKKYDAPMNDLKIEKLRLP